MLDKTLCVSKLIFELWYVQKQTFPRDVPDAEVGNYKGDHVAEHVEGVGHEGHRVGQVPDNQLDKHEGAGEKEHGQEAGPRAARARVELHDPISVLKTVVYDSRRQFRDLTKNPRMSHVAQSFPSWQV